MPPVLAPRSPSPMRLKSWAGRSGTALVPSHRTSSEHSSPSRPSSITMLRPASPKDAPESLAFTSAWASSRVWATRTPLPAARPSVLMTQGPGRVPRKARASATCRASKAAKRAVGTPAAASISFMKALEPSSSAPSAPGPMTARPSARRRSARPSTSGASGPMTTRSASISSAGASVVLIGSAMPGFPGVTTTSAVRASTWASACSRPPLPTTQTFTPWRRRRTVHGPGPPRPGAPARRSARTRRRRSCRRLRAGPPPRWPRSDRCANPAALRTPA